MPKGGGYTARVAEPTPLRDLDAALLSLREACADDVHTLGSLMQMVQVLELAPDQLQLARESMHRSLTRLFQSHGARLAHLQSLAALVERATEPPASDAPAGQSLLEP